MRLFRLLLTLSLPAVAAACALGPSTAPLPAYGWGDTYRFDDGAHPRVEATSADTVLWQDDGRATEVTSRDVLLPPIRESEPHMTVRRRFTGDTNLFPLIPGKRVVFGSRTEWLPHGHGRASVVEENWDCTVGGADSVTTRAGRFDTIRVDCRIHRPGSRRTLQRTYFYAPAIGYYVRLEDRLPPGPTHTTSLIGYTLGNPALSDDAANRRVHAIQLALERHVSGAPVDWRDAAGDASGSVDPVFTVRSKHFGWCREFRERMQVDERRYDLLGTACRGRGGIWQVQQVRPFRTAAR